MFFFSKFWPDRSALLQYYYGFNALLTLAGTGQVIGYSALELPLLTKNDTSDLSILNGNDTAATWFASIVSIAIPLGCIISILTMKSGRRIALMSSGISHLIGWIIVATSYGIVQLLVGRFISGIAVGLTATPAAVYLSEIARLKDKTTLTACTNIASCGGIMLIYLIGFIIPNNWRWVAAAATIVPILAVISILFFTPESPHWLLHKGRISDARKALLRLRGLNSETPQFIGEFNQMINYYIPLKCINNEGNCQPSNLPSSQTESLSIKFRNLLNVIKRPEVWKPFVILNFYFFFQQFCGIYVILAYAVDIIKNSGDSADVYFITVLIGIMQFIGGVALVLCSPRMGRRLLSMISGVGMSISLGVLAIYIQIEKEINLSGYSAIPIYAILLFVGTGSFGFMALPWAMIGELYPTQFINALGPITCCICGIFNFISLQIYPLIVKYDFGIAIYFYCIICIIATVFIIKFLPETHGYSKNEIEQFFKNN